MTERIDSLDTLKGLAIFLVIFIHAQPFLSTNNNLQLLTYTVANLSRIAVPAFLLISGFLLSIKLKEKGKNYEKEELEKIVKYYIIATLAYLPFSIAAGYLQKQGIIAKAVSRPLGPQITGLEGLLDIFYIGKAAGDFLWFLPALFYSIALIHLFYRHDRIKELLAGSLILHVIAILSNTYLVLDFLPIPIEDTLFFGLFFTVSGFYIGKKNLKDWKNRRTFLGLFTLFFILHLLERTFITLTVSPWDVYYWDPYFWGPYSFFTAPMAISFFLYILNRPDWGKGTRLEEYGRYSLLGYLLHPMTIGLFVGISTGLNRILDIIVTDTIVWDFIFLPLIFIITMEISIKLREYLNKRSS